MSKSFLTTYGETIPGGQVLVIIGKGGKVIERKRHDPWFVSTIPKVTGKESRYVSKVSRIPNSDILGFDDARKILKVQGLPVYKVSTFYKRDITKVAKRLVDLSMENGLVGEYNITYEVRATFDIEREGYTMLGYNAPLSFLPNREMVDKMEKVIEDIGELKVMALDIEVYSRHGGFPLKGDPILSITYSTFKLKDDIFSREWIERNVKPIINDDLTSRGTRKLVSEFINVIEREEPDIIIGYNTSGFDFPYIQPFTNSIQTPFGIIKINDNKYYPHIDMMVTRSSLGSTLGLRSFSASSLDEVALEVAKNASKFYDLDWLFNSDYVKAERLVNHAKLKEYFDNKDEIIYNYIKADVYLTVLLGRIWLYPLFMLSILTGIPVTTLQRMNTGQLAEYVLVELLNRLDIYTSIRRKTYFYSKVNQKIASEFKEKVPDWWVFKTGKVYHADWGVYGGDNYYILELDFAQLYPTDMVVNTADPTSLFITDIIDKKDGVVKEYSGTLRISKNLRIEEKSTWSLLKEAGTKKIKVYKTIPGYGPIAWFLYKMYTARKETKKLKDKAKEEGRIELLSPDQAVKIYNNATYGSFSKRTGNIINELLSASVFWRTQKLLYEVINMINNELPKELGVDLKVLYGDTDSSFVLVPKSVKPEIIVRKVNEWIKKRYGELYEMEEEGVYTTMIIPKRKKSKETSGKSYIILTDGKIVKIKGEFFKIELPLAIKDKLISFFEDIINRGITTRKELVELVKEYLKGEPYYKYFIKKSVRSYVSEDDPAKIKSLNKPFHYAGLVSLCENKNPGTRLLTVKATTLSNLVKSKKKVVKCAIDPREVEDIQGAVIVNYLPHTSSDSMRFSLYKGEDDKYVIVDWVTVLNVDKNTIASSYTKGGEYDKEIVIEYAIEELKIEKDYMVKYTIDRIRNVLYTLSEKLLEPLQKGGIR